MRPFRSTMTFGPLNLSREGSTVVARIYEGDEQRCSGAGPDTNNISPQRSLAPVGLPSHCKTRLPADWVALGYFTSLDHRTRYLLDTGSPPHSAWGDCACASVRCDCLEDHLSRHSGRAQQLGFVLGISSAARGLGDRLGSDGDDDLCTFRRLVAQPLRVGCA